MRDLFEKLRLQYFNYNTYLYGDLFLSRTAYPCVHDSIQTKKLIYFYFDGKEIKNITYKAIKT